MGLRPCSLHGGRYVGAAQHAYPAMIRGSQKVSKRHALCPDEFQTMWEFAQSQMECISIYDMSAPYEALTSCISCGAQLEEFSVAFFLTAYPHGQERQDYFGQAHPQCVLDAAGHLGLLQQGCLPDAA